MVRWYRSSKISVVWLDIALRATNDNGCISKEIKANKYFDSEYPDLIQEIQAWIAKIIVAKRFSLIKHCKVKKKILRVIKQLEANPTNLLSIFYKNRYIFKKHKNKTK